MAQAPAPNLKGNFMISTCHFTGSINSASKILLASILFAANAAVAQSVTDMWPPLSATSKQVRFTLPPMGWSSWNTFGRHVNEELIKKTADAMVSSGLRDAGYVYIDIDDGWMKGRERDGTIKADPDKFPSGMKALADYVHAKGLKLGLYTTNYTVTCAGRKGGGLVGSLGHEFQDAAAMAAWGIDLLKFDNCDGGAESFYAIRAALDAIEKKSGKKIYLNLHYVTRPDAFTHTPDSWAATRLGDSARIARDISRNWGTVDHLIDDARVLAPAYIQPGFIADMDSFEVGHAKLSPEEARTHVSVWAVMSAPFMAGNDLTKMDGETQALLTNPEVIAIDQDPLGFGASEVGLGGGQQGRTHVLAKPLASSGSRAVALVNQGDQAASVTMKFADLGLAEGLVLVRDVWAHKDLGRMKDAFSAEVPAHGTMLVTVAGQEPALAGLVDLSAVHWAHGAFNRIDTSPYTSNIAIDAAPPAANTDVKAAAVSTELTVKASLSVPVADRKMSIAGKRYARGFGILGAPTQIAYRLDRKCSEFTADIGVDDTGNPAGAVNFEVWGDGRKLYDSGMMQPGDEARRISVNVGQVAMLRLIVNGQTGGTLDDLIHRSGGQSAFDTADWASPQLHCAAP
jgi:alpha-galactosidase